MMSNRGRLRADPGEGAHHGKPGRECESYRALMHGALFGARLDNEYRWALLSIREDYMGGLDRFIPYLPTGLQARYRLDFLEQAPALQAMQEPARERGWTSPTKPPWRSSTICGP